MYAYTQNNPVMYSDISGESPGVIGFILGYKLLEVIVIAVVVIVAVVVVATVVILEIANEFYYTKQLIEQLNTSKSLPYRGNPSIPGRLYDENGSLKQKRWYGNDGLPIRDRDYTDHGNPKEHPIVPHDHEWDFDHKDDKSPRSKEGKEPDYENYPDD